MRKHTSAFYIVRDAIMAVLLSAAAVAITAVSITDIPPSMSDTTAD